MISYGGVPSFRGYPISSKSLDMWTSVDHVHSERTMVRWGFPHDLRTPPRALGYPTIKDWENVSLMRLSSSLPDVSHVFSSPGSTQKWDKIWVTLVHSILTPWSATSPLLVGEVPNFFYGGILPIKSQSHHIIFYNL